MARRRICAATITRFMPNLTLNLGLRYEYRRALG